MRLIDADELKEGLATLVCMRLADWAELVKAWMQDEGNVKLP